MLIGFESISQATLEETHKAFHKARDYAEVVRKLHDHGIGIQGCFVFGFDNDDESVFERTVEFVDRTRIDLPRYAVMTPFPGHGLTIAGSRPKDVSAQELVALRRRARRLSAPADEPGAAARGAGMGLAPELSLAAPCSAGSGALRGRSCRCGCR